VGKVFLGEPKLLASLLEPGAESGGGGYHAFRIQNCMPKLYHCTHLHTPAYAAGAIQPTNAGLEGFFISKLNSACSVAAYSATASG
jgi:hypothetical protein